MKNTEKAGSSRFPSNGQQAASSFIRVSNMLALLSAYFPKEYFSHFGSSGGRPDPMVVERQLAPCGRAHCHHTLGSHQESHHRGRTDKGTFRSDLGLIKFLVFPLWISGLKTSPGDCKTTYAVWQGSNTCIGTYVRASEKEGVSHLRRRRGQ